jgi:hypothetical protein
MTAFAHMIPCLLAAVVGYLVPATWPLRSIEAETLVLRRQLALFKERGMKRRRIDAATRLRLTFLSL